MGDTSRQTEEQQRPLSQAEQAQSIARDMVERSSHLLANGVSPTLVLIWEWLWAEAQFRPATITIRIATLAEERSGKSRQAAMDNLHELQALGICPIVEGRRGNGGGTRVAVEDPFHVFTDAPRRVEVPPQNEFPFVAELAAIEAEAELERISGEAPSVVAIGTAQVKCNPGDAQGYISPAEPKCNPAASQGYICEVERGDHASLPALLADEVAREIGHERFDLWLGNCSIEWRSPRLNLRCPTDLHARMVRGDIAAAIRAAGRVMLPDFELTIDVESSNVTLDPRRVTFAAQLTNKPPCSLEPPQGSKEQTNSTDGNNLETKKAHPLLVQAKCIYERFEDPTIYRWIAIALAIRIEQGMVTEAQLAKAIEAYHAEGGNLKRCCTKAGIPWTAQYATKNLAWNRHKLKWSREWDRGVEVNERTKPR